MIALVLVLALLAQDEPPDMAPPQRLSEPVVYVGARLLDTDYWTTPDTPPDTSAECPVCGEVEAWVLSEDFHCDPVPWLLIGGYWEYRSNARRETIYADECGHRWRVRFDGGASATGWRWFDTP